MLLPEKPAQAAPMLADYQVVRPLGQGNHGEVYLARPPARLGIDDPFVAVKVFAGQCSEDAFRRVTRELRAFAAVNTPHVALIYDAVLEQAFLYAMEYFPLGSLAKPTHALNRHEVLQAMEHTARAAEALHQAGLTHGDIKPGNVMLHHSGGKLADLGLARPLSSNSPLTSMAPETSIEFLDPALLRGAPPSRSTDIWAIGATLHRALTGTGLYGDLPERQPLLSIRRVQSSAPVIHPALTAPESELIRGCLDSTDNRLTTALAVADHIAALRMYG